MERSLALKALESIVRFFECNFVTTPETFVKIFAENSVPCNVPVPRGVLNLMTSTVDQTL